MLAVDGMVKVGIDHQVELLVGRHQCIYHGHGVLKMHVVVTTAMHQQVAAAHFFHVVHRAVLVVAVRVLLRGAHETLGVDVVVIPPVGDGRHGYGRLEMIGTLGDGQRTQITAIAPAEHADAFGVHKRQAAQILGRFYAVFGFQLAQFHIYAVLEIAASIVRAPWVHCHHNKSLLSHIVHPKNIGHIPTVFHIGAARSAIYIQQHGILF